MPEFKTAASAIAIADLAPYKAFLAQYMRGQVITLQLSVGETNRSVMRQLNAAATENGVRLARLRSPEGSVRFRILPQEKRPSSLSADQIAERTRKASITRALNRNRQSA